MVKILRLALLAMLLGGGVALWAGLMPALTNNGRTTHSPLNPFRTQTALACGLGATPTMMANNIAALAFPFNNNYVQEQIAGVFAYDYPVNQPITFTENFSRVPFAPNPSSFQWQWNFGDGSAFANGVTVTHTFTQTGTYIIESDTYDPTAKQYSPFDSAQIHIIAAAIPNPPVAKARALTPTEILANQSITFDASGSHAVVGSQLTYTWNFGDNTSATGERVTHQFVNVNGVGVVTLIVTDARGAKGTASINIAVGQSGASIHPDATSAHVNAAIGFTAVEPTLPSGPQGTAKLLSVTWDFGDGTAPLTTQTPTASHTFTKQGNYRVAVQFVNTDSSVYVAALTLRVTAAPTVKVSSSGSGGSHWWLLIGGTLALLVVIAISVYRWLAQQRREQLALARQHAHGRLAGARRNPQGQYGRLDPRMGNMGAPRGNTAMRQGVSAPAARRLVPDAPARSSGGQAGQFGQTSQYGQRVPLSSTSNSYPSRGQGAQQGATGRQSLPRRPGTPDGSNAASGQRQSPPNRPGGQQPPRRRHLYDYSDED
jgi:PKD repeat protein